MRKLTIYAILAMALCAAPLNAAELGDSAGKLEIAEWVKGDAFTLEEVRGKKAVVVEFWATWCGPCRVSIPHLTEMAEKYKDDVIFVGVSDETAEVVKPFVEKMGEKMDYVVAVDKEGETSKAYMRAYGQGGIPHAFIVDRQGRIAWHAHPMEESFEAALAQVAAGEFDPAALKAEREEAERMKELFTEYFTLSSTSEADPRFAELEAEFQKNFWSSVRKLDALAWNIASRDWKYQNMKLALSAAERAIELSNKKDASALDTYARVLWELGRKDEAVKYATMAVEAAETDREKEAFQKALEEYQAG